MFNNSSDINAANETNNNTIDGNPTQVHHIGNESLAVIFIFFVLLLGGIVRIFSKKYRVNLNFILS